MAGEDAAVDFVGFNGVRGEVEGVETDVAGGVYELAEMLARVFGRDEAD